jgi:hypothetical protein
VKNEKNGKYFIIDCENSMYLCCDSNPELKAMTAEEAEESSAAHWDFEEMDAPQKEQEVDLSQY